MTFRSELNLMKYFIDTEFMEDGRTIELLSLGIVDEAGLSRYWVNSDANFDHANPWVAEHVIPHMFDTQPNSFTSSKPHREIAKEVLDFVGSEKPQFWGYYAAYDWVAFCQLFGPMVALPKGWPMYCRDIKQLCDSLGNTPLPPQGKGEHHALLDARWNKSAYEFLNNRFKL